MVDAMKRILDMSVQHRAVGPQTDFVCRAMDLQPGVRVGFVLAKLIADFRMKNLGTAAGHASQSGFHHVFQDPTNRLSWFEIQTS